jgi:hypothetical protein
MHMNLDCRPDAMMLEGACIAYQAAIEAYETIQKQGPLVAKRIAAQETSRSGRSQRGVAADSQCGSDRGLNEALSRRDFE